MATNPVTSGLVVQLDSRSYVGSDNDLVSAWADGSGNSNNAASSGTDRPTYKTGIVNGNPVMRFAVDGMTGNVTGGNWAAAQGMQILVLLTNFTASPAFGGIGSLAVSGFDNSSGAMIMGGTSGATNRFGLSTQNATRLTWDVPSNPVLTVYSGGFSASRYAWGMNDAMLEGLGTLTVGTTTDQYGVGCRLFGGITAGVTADYCMFLVYDRLITQTEYRDVSRWMLAEFGPAASGGASFSPIGPGGLVY